MILANSEMARDKMIFVRAKVPSLTWGLLHS